MKELKGRNAILTGASGGLGFHIAESMAAAGINLFLVAYPGDGLEEVQAKVRKGSVKASHLSADLRQMRECETTLAKARQFLGSIDILVNNAGIEYTAPYDHLECTQILEVLRLNLEAPMVLTRLLLPDLLKQNCGHIVNVSSLAGKSGPAYQEPYAASKAGLIAFTASIRASLRASGVSASLICPGFVEAGIYKRLKERTGCEAPRLMGTCQPAKVAQSVITAIQQDLPEVIVNKFPVRPLLAIICLWPRIGEKLVHLLGANRFFMDVWEAKNSPRAKPH